MAIANPRSYVRACIEILASPSLGDSQAVEVVGGLLVVGPELLLGQGQSLSLQRAGTLQVADIRERRRQIPHRFETGRMARPQRALRQVDRCLRQLEGFTESALEPSLLGRQVEDLDVARGGRADGLMYRLCAPDQLAGGRVVALRLRHRRHQPNHAGALSVSRNGSALGDGETAVQPLSGVIVATGAGQRDAEALPGLRSVRPVGRDAITESGRALEQLESRR